MEADSEWLTLGEASRFLGVDESTLRTWADAGRIPMFRTPGGHRRFARQALAEFLERSRRDDEPRLRDLIGPHADRLVLDAVERIRAQRWYQALDQSAAQAIGAVCHDLMDALGGYLLGGAQQQRHLTDGERAGRELGARVTGLHLSPADATEAFLFFKQIIIDSVSIRLPLSPDRKVQSLRRLDAFLDRVLLQMMSAYERPNDS
ncbi:MAG: MerR family transcriptional regulator [bacterium]